jgi:Golgi nucleoside diphosphatase
LFFLNANAVNTQQIVKLIPAITATQNVNEDGSLLSFCNSLNPIASKIAKLMENKIIPYAPILLRCFIRNIRSISCYSISRSNNLNSKYESWSFMIKSITAIAFIECTLDNNWQTKFGYPNFTRRVEFSQYIAMSDESQASLVDIGNTRRYFQFKNNSIIQIANNVISFRAYEANELAVDESKQFPRNPRIDE